MNSVMKSTGLPMSDISAETLPKLVKSLLPEFGDAREINPLSGGNINYVWRILNGKNESIIAKHAPPHIASNPDVPLSRSRIRFEAEALKLFRPDGELEHVTNSLTRTPRILAFNEQDSLLLMEDVGTFTELNNVQLSSQIAESIGQRLGAFIGNLHRTTFNDPELSNIFQNEEIQSVRYQVQYESAHEYAGEIDDQVKNQIKEKSQALGKSLQQSDSGTCLLMGDLWPPSVFVGNGGSIRLIDWEFVHFGRPLQDVGHFAAHCWMQIKTAETTQLKENWRTIWKEFWSAYKMNTGDHLIQLFDARELLDLGTHIGTEILIRAFGPFKAGYVFEGESTGSKFMTEVLDEAAEFIIDPEKVRQIFLDEIE